LKKVITTVILVALILASFTTILSASRVKADLSEARILSYSWYIAPSTTVLAQNPGDLVVVGEVQNVGSNIIGSVIITGFAYNSSGTALDSTSFQAFGTDLLPGQISPFYLDFLPVLDVAQDTMTNSYTASVTNVTVQVVVVSDTNVTQYSGLATESVTSYLDNTGTFTVSGNVQNNGTKTVGNVWVLATFYNSSGTVVGLNETAYLDPSGSLAPGDSVAFIATPADSPAELSNGEVNITSYSLLIQSSPLVGSPSPTPSTSATSSPPPTSPTASSTKSPAPVSSGLIYEVAVVAIVVVVAVLAAMLLLRKRHKNAQFEPPPPPPPP